MDDLSGKLSRRHRRTIRRRGVREEEARLTWPGNPMRNEWLGKALAKYLKTGLSSGRRPPRQASAAQGKHYPTPA